MLKCICPFCLEPSRPIVHYTDAALTWLVQTTDDHHRRKRVNGYIELFYRAGVFDPMMPYRVWITVMGTDVDPPFATAETNYIGAFQPRRLPDGRPLDAQWEWWDAVDRQMPWSELH